MNINSSSIDSRRDPMTGRYLPSSQTLEERFWSKVDKRSPDDCWEWKANRHSFGYGNFWIKQREYGAHVVAYELTYGRVPKGLCVCHTCDNPACCNPNHMFLGSRGDNNRDRDRKGRRRTRGAFGERHRSAKLKNTDIPRILELIEEGLTYRSIAVRYGVSSSRISDIKNGKGWTCVTGNPPEIVCKTH
jgi:hypothetical protein